jgi:hypothetical protein
MAVSGSAVFTAFSSSSVPGIEPQLDHCISQNIMELEAEPEFDSPSIKPWLFLTKLRSIPRQSLSPHPAFVAKVSVFTEAIPRVSSLGSFLPSCGQYRAKVSASSSGQSRSLQR